MWHKMRVVVKNLAIVLLSILVHFSVGQTTPFDEYSQVLVVDEQPDFEDNANKVYTTTLNLVKTDSTVQFNSDTFTAEAGKFYATTLRGFITVENVVNQDLSGDVIKVTYDARYQYDLITSFNDSYVSNTIGSFEYVRKGLNSQDILFSLYAVQDDASAFSFGGSSMCPLATCTGAYVTCVETTSGTSVTCVSSCKAGYCYNGGICSQTDADMVPTCMCTTLNDLWYLGQRCETRITLWLVILLSVIGFLIIVVVIIIVCWCVIKKRRRRRHKEKLANTPLSNGVQNNGFVRDEATVKTVPQVNLVPRSIPSSSIRRDDSFDTVTESNIGSITDRQDRDGYRHSHAGSRTSSTHHSHHHRRHHDSDHHRDRHHRHHDDRHRRHRRHRSRSTEFDRHQRRSRSLSSSRNDSSDAETIDVKNLSYYEINVDQLDAGDDDSGTTDEPASVAASNSTTSPIRWLPPRGIESRPGWVPSLGPMMYDLKRSTDNLDQAYEEPVPEYESVDARAMHMGDTDL